MYRILTVIAFVISVAWLATSPGFEPAVACIASVAAVLRDEFHAVIGLRMLSLTPRTAPIRSLTHTRYSFSRPEYVNPMIIADLWGWISDLGDQVVSVNIPGANSSNRYFADVAVEDGKPYPIVSAKADETRVSYQYLGCSFSGVHLLRVWSSGGGTGVFCAIMLLTLSAEAAIDVEIAGTKKVDRFIVKKIASLPLGDRYEGKLSYRFGLLTIGECTGRRSLRKSTQRMVVL